MKLPFMMGLLVLLATPVFAQQGPNVPDLPYESVPFLKITPDRNLGEVLSVAVNLFG